MFLLFLLILYVYCGRKKNINHIESHGLRIYILAYFLQARLSYPLYPMPTMLRTHEPLTDTQNVFTLIFFHSEGKKMSINNDCTLMNLAWMVFVLISA